MKHWRWNGDIIRSILDVLVVTLTPMLGVERKGFTTGLHLQAFSLLFSLSSSLKHILESSLTA